ncbi:MAG: sensor histidine kinase [Myxococcaceae bacterium]
MTRPSSRVLSQLAHDLRSPLNVIGGTLTELSSEGVLTAAERAQIVALSQRAVERLLSLSNRLALAASLEHPVEPALAPLDLVQLTRDTLEKFVPGQLRRRVEVVTAFPATAVLVRADSSLLTALLLELLSNANRFARRKLHVAVSMGESAVVTVEDDGEGVPEDERAVLFEPFAERRSRTGLGMGLWLARSLAGQHGGTLTVDFLAPGTRQQLTLPICS